MISEERINIHLGELIKAQKQGAERAWRVFDEKNLKYYLKDKLSKRSLL